MSWVKLDDGILKNRKIRAVSGQARFLFIAGLLHCASDLTDGFIADYMVGAVAGEADIKKSTPLVKELVEAGLWHKRDEGFEVHDYLDYQPSAESERERRAAHAERVRKWRNGKGPRDASCDTSQDSARDGPGDGVSDALPEPDPEESQSQPVSEEPRPPLAVVKPEKENVKTNPQVRGTLSTLVEARDPIPGVLYTPTDRTVAASLAERTWILLTEAGGRPTANDVVDLVWWALHDLDPKLVDEVLGYCWELEKRPQRVAYLRRTVRDWAGQRGIKMAEFKAAA